MTDHPPEPEHQLADPLEQPFGPLEPGAAAERRLIKSRHPISGNGLLEFGGTALLAYSGYQVLMVAVSSGSGPEAVIGRFSELNALFPLLFLAVVLILAVPRDSSDLALRQSGKSQPSSWQRLVRWLPLFLAITYLLGVPAVLLSELTIVQGDANKIRRLETRLQQRKQQILKAVASDVTAEDFRISLRRFPEILSTSIDPRESPDTIRQGIAAGIQQGIKLDLQRLRTRAFERRERFGKLARNAGLTALVTGLLSAALACRVLPWLTPAAEAMGATAVAVVRAILALPRRLNRWLRRLLRRLLRPVLQPVLTPLKRRRRAKPDSLEPDSLNPDNLNTTPNEGAKHSEARQPDRQRRRVRVSRRKRP